MMALVTLSSSVQSVAGLAITAPAFRRALHPAARQRAMPVRVSASNLTMGDVLAGCLTRQIAQLPEEAQAIRAEGALDAVVNTGTSELEAIRKKLGNDLYHTACNTLYSLHKGMEGTESVYLSTLNSTALRIDAMLAPTRDAVRAELAWHQEELAARQMAKQREAARRRGFKRAFTWRDTTALSRAAARPKHPVVRVCEASSLLLSLMLLFAFADIASTLNILGPPPTQPRTERIRHPRAASNEQLRAQLLDSAAAPVPVAFPPHRAVAPHDAAAAPPMAAPPMAVYRGRRPMSTNWWLAMQGPLYVYLASLGVIVLRSGTDEWAALAIGIEPDDPESRLRGSADLGYVRFEYDWEQDKWRQASD